MDTDVKAGKRTMAVRMGKNATQKQYAITLAAAYIVPIIQVISGQTSPMVLLTLLSLPLAVKRYREFTSLTGSALNPVLEKTAKLLVIFGILYAAGFVIPVP
jgi:1,4-dihydroxy-2-naphthoate octaprenyltransferase